MTAIEAELFNKKVRQMAARLVDEIPDEIRTWANSMQRETAIGCGCALISLTVNAVTNEMLFNRRHSMTEDDENWINHMKIGSSGVTILLLFSCFRYRYFEASIFQYKRMLKKKEWYIGFGIEKKEELDETEEPSLISMALLRDWLLVGCQPVPFVNKVDLVVNGGLGFQQCTYNLDTFLIVMMFLCRLFLFWRYPPSRGCLRVA